MKAMLLFPPTWHPSQPYLSLPSLTGFLKHEGVTDIVQRDLGIEVLDGFLSQAAGRETYERMRSEEHTSELQSQSNLVCRLLLEKKKQFHNGYGPKAHLTGWRCNRAAS